jgi:hypothetical protein
MTCQVSKQNFVQFGGVFKINYSAKQYTHQQQIDLALPDTFIYDYVETANISLRIDRKRPKMI